MIGRSRPVAGAGNLVLAAAGNVDHAQLVGLAEQHFAALPGGSTAPAARARFTSGERRVRSRGGVPSYPSRPAPRFSSQR